MKALVTGGLGFIGSNFIRYMLDRHEDCWITNVDALRYGSNIDNLKDLEKSGRYELVCGDIADPALISGLVERSDVVINFAAETHVDRSISHPDSFLQSNVMGVFNLLEAIRKKNTKCRFVQISTDEVYGDILEGSFNEGDTIRPSSPYSASKASGDVFVMAYARTYGLQAMITRCTNNYGRYQFPEKLIPKTILRAASTLKIPIYGTGKNVRDWIYVLDHCSAVERVIFDGRPGEVYNVSAGDEKANLEVVGDILEIMGLDDGLIEFVEDRPGHDVRYSLDSSKIRNELGWSPKQSFKSGIKETVDWYLENEAWWKPLMDSKVLHKTPWKLDWRI